MDESESKNCECEHCKWFDNYQNWTSCTASEQQFDRNFKVAWAKLCSNCPAHIAYKLRNKKVLKPTHPKGLFAGTLTGPPGTKGDDMNIAIRKIMSQKTTPVIKYAWYQELTKQGTPHIHFIYETPTGGRILQKVFKRYWPLWDETSKKGAGHTGGYHKLVVNEDAYLDYIKKDGGTNESEGFM